MKIVFFIHPDFLRNKSMDRFARLLSDGMKNRGHTVESWSPDPFASRLSKMPFILKWLSYIDLFIIFPLKVKRLLKTTDKDTSFVFVDQTLGPWVSLVANRPTVVHCHDFLALRSARGEIRENPTAWTGRIYQDWILKGFSKARNFISVSKKTNSDLHEFILSKPLRSEVVYNGLHQKFARHESRLARAFFGGVVRMDLSEGYLLHVGGNTWYKNRIGVVEIYEAWRDRTRLSLPLLLIGAPLSPEMERKVSLSKYRKDIHPMTDIDDGQLVYAYAGATVFLFPSLGEGFGWPIAEAMAAGTLVITTDEAPMSEVAGDAGFLEPKRPASATDIAAWSEKIGATIEKIVNFSPEDREAAVHKGIVNASRFDTDASLDQIEAIYKRVLSDFHGPKSNTYDAN